MVKLGGRWLGWRREWARARRNWRRSRGLRLFVGFVWRVGILLLAVWIGFVWGQQFDKESRGVRGRGDSGCTLYYQDGSRSRVDSPACWQIEGSR